MWRQKPSRPAACRSKATEKAASLPRRICSTSFSSEAKASRRLDHDGPRGPGARIATVRTGGASYRPYRSQVGKTVRACQGLRDLARGRWPGQVLGQRQLLRRHTTLVVPRGERLGVAADVLPRAAEREQDHTVGAAVDELATQVGRDPDDLAARQHVLLAL